LSIGLMLRHPGPHVCLMPSLIMYGIVHTSRKQYCVEPPGRTEVFVVGSDLLLGDAKEIRYVSSIPNLPFMGFTLGCKIPQTLTRPLRLTSA
jgi:hypothetical protein